MYSLRYEKHTTGETGYNTKCSNFWSDQCPRKFGTKIQCRNCEYRKWKPLELAQIIAHLEGKADDASDVVGIYPLFPDDTCRFMVFDFDNHEKDADKHDSANTDDEYKSEVSTFREICVNCGIPYLTERSRSGKGAHVWIFFGHPISAGTARLLGNLLLMKGAESINLKSFRYYDRMLPMQDHLPEGGLGNLIALPLQGKALLNGNSAFIDEKWNAYPDQWKALFETEKLSPEAVADLIKEWKKIDVPAISDSESSDSPDKPWEKDNGFHKEDADGIVKIILADGVYIDAANLKPRLQNKIRRLAAFGNPKFYKNQAIGLSNYENSRVIYLGKEEGKYIEIPRGLSEVLKDKCDEAEIKYVVKDKRMEGRHIDVNFKGHLKESQKSAVQALIEKDTGILSAATAFGKTVVCTYVIAQKKVSTLILLQSSSLMEQWEKALNDFLQINEELPEYRTKSGRSRTRKNLVGTIQGAHDSSTGIIDIAMAGSLCKKGEYHKRLSEYGLVILDECHHAASDTIIEVLQQVRAKYVYGVTATPIRGDGLQKINYMLLGPVRYTFTAKDRAKEQGIGHYVIPRFTRAIASDMSSDTMHPNEAYAIVRNNEARDELIIRDVINIISEKRTPVVLTRFRDHAEKIYAALSEHADHIFLLSGSNSKKEHKKILEEMQNISENESMILVATGQLIGEGFDYPRLDTLFMATPVSGSQVVEQYAGRLNRDYKGKTKVIVYDYVDSHIPVFDRMYAKRLRAYRKIGYEILTGTLESQLEQETQSIFNIDNYYETLMGDLLKARKEIIISSPAISRAKIEELSDLIGEKQANGLSIKIVTWDSDSYGYGDSGYWASLHELMRSYGFDVRTVTDFCEHYIILDRELVWYGSMNFLAKADVEDNLMRIMNIEVATELMEMTFGRENTRIKINNISSEK